MSRCIFCRAPSPSATCVECARLARLSRRRPFCCELTSRVVASPPRTLRRIGVSEQAVCSCGAYVFAAAVEAETQRLLSWRSP